MAITVNGQILRNLPEQVSKNTDDILELQDVSNNYGIRITALEQGAIALATFQDCTFTGTSSFQGPLISNDGFTFNGNGSVGGNLAVAGSSTFTGTVTASGNENVGGNLAVTGNVTASSFYGDNAKPIYWHGLEMYQESNKGVVYAHILNNDNTPITLASLTALMNSSKPRSFYLDAHGVVDIEGVQYDVIQVYRYMNDDDIKFILKSAGGFISSNAINLTDFFSGMNDNAINKIN